MMTRRRAALAGAAALGMIALTSCDKPTPLVTLVSGTHSSHAEAVCYSDGDKPVDITSPKCMGDKGGPKISLKLSVGDRFGIGTETELADKGWFIAFNGERSEQAIVRDTTFENSLEVPAEFFALSDTFRMQIVEQHDDEPGSPAKGVWIVEIKKK